MLGVLELWAWVWDLPWLLGSGVRITPQGRGSFPFRETARLASPEWKLRQFVGKYIFSVIVKGKGLIEKIHRHIKRFFQLKWAVKMNFEFHIFIQK